MDVVDSGPGVAVAEEPAGTPVAPALEWSPWAQALGLGAPAPEGELVADPLAGPGIAEMIAEAHGLADMEFVPVPLAPVADEGSLEAGLAPGVQGVPVAQPEAPAWVPEPRSAVEDGQAGSDAGSASEAEQDAAEDVPRLAPEAATPDPLAGGLLAQLMTGVRGL
jgi:hypothetical protein